MDIIEFQKRWIMRYINPIFFYLPFQSCQVNEIGFNIKVLLWNTYNPVKDDKLNGALEIGGLTSPALTIKGIWGDEESATSTI